MRISTAVPKTTAVMQCRKSGSEVRRPQPIATESAKLANTEPALRKITRPPGVHISIRMPHLPRGAPVCSGAANARPYQIRKGQPGTPYAT